MKTMNYYIDGISTVLDISGNVCSLYKRANVSGGMNFHSDYQALAKDWEIVGQYIRQGIYEHQREVGAIESLENIKPQKIPVEEELPAKVEGRIIRLIQEYSGPLPSSREFGGYEKVLPGSADRILKMAESQSEHRQKMEG